MTWRNFETSPHCHLVAKIYPFSLATLCSWWSLLYPWHLSRRVILKNSCKRCSNHGTEHPRDMLLRLKQRGAEGFWTLNSLATSMASDERHSVNNNRVIFSWKVVVNVYWQLCTAFYFFGNLYFLGLPVSSHQTEDYTM